jgi:hypothetical protein
MLDDGQSSEAIFNFMRGPPGAIDPMLAPDGTGGQPAGQLPDLWRPAFQPIPRTQIPTSHPARLTADQLTRTHDVPRVHGNAPSTYASMHELFDEGDLAQSIEHERPTDTISMMGNPSGARGVPMSHGNTPSVQADTPMIQDTDVMRNYSEPMNHGFNLAGFGDRSDSRRQYPEARPSLRSMRQISQEMRPPRADVAYTATVSRNILRHTWCYCQPFFHEWCLQWQHHSGPDFARAFLSVEQTGRLADAHYAAEEGGYGETQALVLTRKLLLSREPYREVKCCECRRI